MILGGFARPFTAIGKLDVHSIQSEREAKLAIDALIDADLPYIVVFLHSFSLIEEPGGGAHALHADALSTKVFSALLDRIVQNKLRVATAREVSAHVVTVDIGNRDVVPSIDLEIPAYKYAARMMRSNSERHSPACPPDCRRPRARRWG